MRDYRSAWNSMLRALLLLMFSITGAAIAQQQSGMTAAMIADLETVRQSAISPDGKQIAYILRTPRSESDKPGSAYGEVWVMDSNGANAVKFLSPPFSASSVQWSPDGKMISFLTTAADLKKGQQVYGMPVNGGSMKPLTANANKVIAYRWSPDGKSIVYTARDGKSEEQLADEKTGKDWTVYDSDPKYVRLWSVDVVSGAEKQLNNQPLSVGNFVWTPDGQKVAFQAAENPSTDSMMMFSKMYSIAATGGSAEVYCQTTGKMGAMAFSPDGKKLAFLNAVDISDPLAQSLFVVDGAGKTPRNLMPGMEASAVNLTWTNNSRILVLATKRSHTALLEFAAVDGNVKTVYEGTPIISTMSLHRASGRLAVVASDPQFPAEVFSGSAKGGELERLTFHNRNLNDIVLGKQEVFRWKSSDGIEIEGILTYPLDYVEGRRYPLILQIHGGPEGVSLNGWNTRPSYPVQLLAAQGYMVLEPNYRGSAGRGVAFSKADHDDLGGQEYQDVLDGIDALVNKGIVDNARVGTGGWSYGGYFSAWGATRHSERFKASAVCAGLTNWISFSGTTDIPHEMSLVHWNSYWYDEVDLHRERSPISHLDKAATPTLIVHGMKDVRVHPEQSIQLYNNLKLKNVPTRLITYPREPHGLLERANQLHYMQNLLEWYDRYVRDAENQQDQTSVN